MRDDIYLFLNQINIHINEQKDYINPFAPLTIMEDLLKHKQKKN